VALDIELAFARTVEHAELEWLDPEFARDEIDRRFGRKHALNIARRAHETARNGVGVDRGPLEALVGNTVGKLRLGTGENRRDHLPGRVRAAVEERLDVQRDHLAFGRDAGSNGDLRSVPHGGRADVVEVVADELHRTSAGRRQVIARELFDRETLCAEIAADVARVNDEFVLRQARRYGELFAQAER
jgi:hypothetical protein